MRSEAGVGSSASIRRDLPTGTVTFLFTDIEGSTRLVSELGDRFDSLLGTHNELIRQALDREGGIEVSTEGDAFFAAFPSAPPSPRRGGRRAAGVGHAPVAR